MLDVLFVYDEVGWIFEVNVKVCESLGYSVVELFCFGVVDIEMEFDQVNVEVMWCQMVFGKIEIVYGWYWCKDGSEFLVEVYVVLLLFFDLWFFFSVVCDIIECKLFEECICFQVMVFDNVEEGIVIMDVEGRVVDVNLVFECIIEYFCVELFGKNLCIFNLGQYEFEFYLVIWEVLWQQGVWSGEIWN